MYYNDYLKLLNTESLLSPKFIISFFICFVFFSVTSRLIFGKRTDKDYIFILNRSLNVVGYVVYSFILITITDYNYNFDKTGFWFSEFELEPIPEIIKQHINEKYSDINELNQKENIELTYTGFNWSEISITPEAEKLINTSKVISQYNLNDEQILQLKKILSDPNPDPKDLSGKSCSSETKNCKWCGKEFILESKYYSSKQLLSNIVEPAEDPLQLIGLLINIGYVDPLKCIESYENGNKYQCIVTEDKEFCSLKCEKEFKNSRGY
ncbi:hypothetical protein [Chryseobacterium sp. IT-36CA2]|uniref:hypothetical protein n=1 Tax=Chryseobacterium sp. IT-36CA2 TaxID=3026460 RepID=UPI0039E13C3A